MFKGSMVAIVTPMSSEGAIDYEAFSRLLDWHLENKTDAIVVLGTTGESATINHSEREALISHTVDQLKGRLPVIVGTGANSTSQTIGLTQQAMSLGADAALLVTPYYNKPTQEGLYQHYKAVAKAVSLPQILYNVPARTGCDMLPSTVIRLAHCSNIVGIKEATGDMDRVKTILDSDSQIAVYSGDDATALKLIQAGGRGVISVVANVAPQAVSALCQAALQGDFATAKQWDDKLRPLYEALFVESNPIPAKWALQFMGKISHGIRLPLTPLAEKFHAVVRSALTQAGV